MVRLNPDVTVYDESRLRGLMARPAVHGVFANCLQTHCDEFAPPALCSDAQSYLLMSDFFAFRPDRVRPYDGWLTYRGRGDQAWAEEWTSLAFAPLVDGGRFAWIQSYSNSSSCKVSQPDIAHSHERWPTKLDHLLAGRTSCPGHHHQPCGDSEEEATVTVADANALRGR